jgi:hypothetical protein
VGRGEGAVVARDDGSDWPGCAADRCCSMGVAILGPGAGGKGRDGTSGRFGGRIGVGVAEREDEWEGRSTETLGAGGEV